MIRHLPNTLTLLGVCCTSLAVGLYVSALRDPWLVILLLVAGQSCDILDGWLARRYRVESRLGAELDLTCDRVLTHVMGVAMFEKAWLVALPFVAVAQVRFGRSWSGRSCLSVTLIVALFVEGWS